MEITKAKTQLLPNGWILFKVGCTRRSNTYVGIYIYRSYLVICIYISFHHFCPVLFYFNVSFKEIAGYKKNQTNKQTKKKKRPPPHLPRVMLMSIIFKILLYCIFWFLLQVLRVDYVRWI